MAILFANNASTTIQGNIAFSDSTVQLAAGTAGLFPQPTGSDYFVATFYDQATKSQYEIVHVTSVNVATSTASIQRGQEGTAARGWSAGDIFANLVTAGTLQQFVQAGTGPANTSFIYVGTDAGPVNQIVANTNPVPPALAIGMTFQIKIANTNTQATTASLNGLTAYPLKRTDGSDLVGNNIVAGEEVMLVWNGTHFSTAIPPIPQPPPQNVFYVSPTGNDNNSGFSWGTAFQTIQGAINSIKAKYISSNTITIRVADGSYSQGAQDSTSYIASWSIVGDTAAPGNCVINAQSTNGASYTGGAPAGRCFVASGTCNMSIQGFTLESYLENIAAVGGGVMYAANNAYTTPSSGIVAPLNAYTGSTLSVQGVNTYTGFGGAPALMLAAQGATMIVGYHDFFSGSQMVMNIQGTASFGGATAVATDGGVIYCYNEIGASIFTGAVPTGYQFVANNGGGFIFSTSNINTFPGTIAGVVTSPGWLSHG